MFNKFIKDYLQFSRKERVGLLAFLSILAFVIFLPELFKKKKATLSIQQDTLLLQSIDTLNTTQQVTNFENREDDISNFQYEPSQTKGFVPGELFAFDPNSISADEWRRLGLNDKTTQTILKYRNKGGKFYKPEDLMKIWGLPEGFYERVKDYITLSNSSYRTPTTYTPSSFEKTERKVAMVNINEADTSAFISLPGIGSKLSVRIITFRERLGGFYSIDQIKETYGLPDSTFQKIKPRLLLNIGAVKKLNINTATKDELKLHPYLKWNLANAIVEYRNQHGPFKSLDDLKNIVLIDDITFARIVNYISL